MNEYIIDVRTKKDLGNEAFINDLLTAWCNDIDPNLQLEFFGLGEPVRQSFAEKGIKYAVETWIENGLGLMLKRGNRYRFIASVDWREEIGLDESPFPWSCTVWLTPKAGDVLATELFKFLIEHFEPAFGHLSTYERDREKHFVSIEDNIGTIEAQVGLDIDDKLPGIYWITYFGDWAIKQIGATKFDSLSNSQCEKFKDGLLIKAYPSSKEIGTEDANKTEKLVLDQLGQQHFFDKSLFDLESLLLDSETESVIEQKIGEMKS